MERLERPAPDVSGEVSVIQGVLGALQGVILRYLTSHGIRPPQNVTAQAIREGLMADSGIEIPVWDLDSALDQMLRGRMLVVVEGAAGEAKYALPEAPAQAGGTEA